uniref:Uncharacterized protein n=1 Tax=Scleropages formosus TaxID=113540 RepID=A0A8C9V796_SCLFO
RSIRLMGEAETKAKLCSPQQPVGRDVVPSTLLQEISHPQVATLERQRQELLEINRTWDKQYRRMKQHYEAKVGAERRALLSAQLTGISQLLRKNPTGHFLFWLQKRNSTMNADLLELERHMRQLKLQYDSLTTRGRQQGCEIRRLNKVTEAWRSGEARGERRVPVRVCVTIPARVCQRSMLMSLCL